MRVWNNHLSRYTLVHSVSLFLARKYEVSSVHNKSCYPLNTHEFLNKEAIDGLILEFPATWSTTLHWMGANPAVTNALGRVLMGGETAESQEFHLHLYKLWSDTPLSPHSTCLRLSPRLLLSEITSITLARHQTEIRKQEERITVAWLKV